MKCVVTSAAFGFVGCDCRLKASKSGGRPAMQDCSGQQQEGRRSRSLRWLRRRGIRHEFFGTCVHRFQVLASGDHRPRQVFALYQAFADDTCEMSRNHGQKAEGKNRMDRLRRVADGIGRYAGERSLLFFAAEDKETCRREPDERRRPGRGSSVCPGGLCPRIMWRSQHQQTAYMVPEMAGRARHAAEPRVLGAEQAPDETKQDQDDNGVAGPCVDAHPPLGRDEAGQETDGYRHDKKPMEQPGRQVPDIDSVRVVPGRRSRSAL